MVKSIINKDARLVRSLSRSKVSMWLKSKKQFAETYFEGKDFFETKEILFGSTLGKILELGEYENTELIVNNCLRGFDGLIKEDKRKEKILYKSCENILKNTEFVEKLNNLSFEFGALFEIKLMKFIDNVCLIGFADNGTHDWKKIKEFKTGKTPWTQEKVNEHGQLDFYCLMIYMEKGYFPDDVELIWLETMDNEDGEIIPTGKITTFKYEIDKERILEWINKIPKIFEEIMNFQLEWQNKKEVANEDGFEKVLIYQLYQINDEMKKLEEKAQMLKKEIEESLKENNLDGFKIEGVCNVYSMSRKSWDYGNTLKDIEKIRDEEIKEIKNKNSKIFSEIEILEKNYGNTLKTTKEKFESENKPLVKTNICYKF